MGSPIQIRSNETAVWPVYEAKWTLFKLIFYYIKVLAHACPFGCSILRVRALKWGSVCFPPQGASDLLKFQVRTSQKVCFYFIKWKIYGAVLMPLEINHPTVPQLKPLTHSIENLNRHGLCRTFQQRYTVLKSAILLHIRAKRRFHVTAAV